MTSKALSCRVHQNGWAIGERTCHPGRSFNTEGAERRAQRTQRRNRGFRTSTADGPLRKSGPTKSQLEAGGTKWSVGAGGGLGGEDFAGEEDDGSADETGDTE